MPTEEPQPIEQLPEGQYFMADATISVCPAGFRGWLPPMTGHIEPEIVRSPSEREQSDL